MFFRERMPGQRQQIVVELHPPYFHETLVSSSAATVHAFTRLVAETLHLKTVMMSWTYGVSVYLGGRHWAHDGVYGVVHEAVGHAVLLDDVLAYWSIYGGISQSCDFRNCSSPTAATSCLIKMLLELVLLLLLLL